MRILVILFLLLLAAPALSQPGLTITDARKPNPVAAHARFLEDLTHKLTYEQVARFPADSFQQFSHPQFIQLAYRAGTIWIRFVVSNQTADGLFLISSRRRYQQLTAYVQQANGTTMIHEYGYSVPFASQPIPTMPPVIPLGLQPTVVYLQIRTIDSLGDYLHIGGVGQVVVYQKNLMRWQSFMLGIYSLAFFLALILFGRMRDALTGWYALLLFGFLLFYVDFYGFLNEYVDYHWWRRYIPTSMIYVLCWSLFHIQYLNLRYYVRWLYWLIVGLNALYFVDFTLKIVVTALTGSYHSLLYQFLWWLRIDWGGYTLFILLLLLAGLVWVSIKNFRSVYLYAIAFSSSLLTMIISLLALYDLDWLPYLPYNNLFVPGTLVELVLLGYILANRASEHRRGQTRTQQQLIDQLQANLRQRDKLLHIRNQIAHDLHDQVGATLTSIAISTKFVQKKVNGQQPDIALVLQQIQTDSQETIHAIRETVWALNSDNDPPQKLFDRMQTTATQLLANGETELVFQNELDMDTLPAFSMETRRNVYLVFREALHNVVKHAQASRVKVRLWQQGDEVRIQITDNGRGFEQGPTAVWRTSESNGLANFQKRAAEGGFGVTVSSEVEQGTIVDIQIPINMSISDASG